MNEDLYLLKNIVHTNTLSNHQLHGNVSLTSVGKTLKIFGNSEFDGEVTFNDNIEATTIHVSNS